MAARSAAQLNLYGTAPKRLVSCDCILKPSSAWPALGKSLDAKSAGVGFSVPPIWTLSSDLV